VRLESIKGEYLIRCEDGRTRWAPVGLANELERVFRKEEIVAKGPVIAFENGVKIKLVEDPPANTLIDLTTLPHVVMRGPIENMRHVAPFVNSPDGNRMPPTNAVLIVDTAITSEKTASWVVQWPGFESTNGKLVVRALLNVLGIPVRVRVQKDDLRDGRWRIYRNGTSIDSDISVARVDGRRLQGSKYKWEELRVNEPVSIEATSTANLQNNFTAWAKRRNIFWRVKFRELAPGLIEATRQPDVLRFLPPIGEPV
jgi:hypothetical protein